MYTNQRQNQDTKELRRLGGKWLKERRESAGLSQRQLAEILGVEYYTFISQIETGHGRIPPDRYEAWAGAIGLDLADFVREILRYYDPVTFSILFGTQTPGGTTPHGPLIQETRARDSLAAENRQLREQVHELQRLLGKKTMELEQVRENLAGATGKSASGKPSSNKPSSSKPSPDKSPGRRDAPAASSGSSYEKTGG